MNRKWNNFLIAVREAVELALYGKTRKTELSRKYSQQVNRVLRRIGGRQ